MKLDKAFDFLLSQFRTSSPEYSVDVTEYIHPLCFLEKRSAIATITDIAGKKECIDEREIEEVETLDDFIPEESPS